MDTLEQYINDIREELDINDMNVREVQMRAPARKHFWVARLINHKRTIEQLKAKRSEQVEKVIEKIQRDAPAALPQTRARAIAKDHKSVQEIDNQLREQELIVELLESAIKNYDSLHWAIKNIVEIMKLETM